MFELSLIQVQHREKAETKHVMYVDQYYSIKAISHTSRITKCFLYIKSSNRFFDRLLSHSVTWINLDYKKMGL